MLYEYKATIVNVVDGDTVDIKVDLGFFHTWQQRFRLYGIDTPERGQIGFNEAKARLAGLVLGKEVVIQTHKNRAGAEQIDKYGRWLATIFLPNSIERINVNNLLIAEGLAAPYMV